MLGTPRVSLKNSREEFRRKLKEFLFREANVMEISNGICTLKREREEIGETRVC